MQTKTELVDDISAKTGLNTHRGKTKIMHINNQSVENITTGEEVLEEVETFSYLGSIICKTGGTDEELE
jgi:nucleoid DNA-binding protein